VFRRAGSAIDQGVFKARIVPIEIKVAILAFALPFLRLR